ncbi:MAG: Uma2 family endonuclease [Janthinobacterium lividum]
MATALLEKQEVKAPDTVAEETGPVPYHWTAEAMSKALDAGVFEHPERLELIQGRIIENMSQNAPHASLRRRIGRLLRGVMEPPFLVMEESSLRLALDGEPVPDVLVVIGTEADYDLRHPTQAEAMLVVEVSDTSAAYDLGSKSILYAQAAIADYWVVLVNTMEVVVHREPSPDGYQNVMRLTGTNALSPLAMPDAVWTIDALLGKRTNQ